MSRRKLVDGCLVKHDVLGIVRVHQRVRQDVTPPELWYVERNDVLVAPSCYSELELHRVLRCGSFNRKRPYVFVDDEFTRTVPS